MVVSSVLLVGVVLETGELLDGVELSVVLEGVVEPTGVLEVTGSVVVLDDVGVVVVLETPVPATCRFGMTPSGMTSARMVAKPKTKANMIVTSLDSRRTIWEW